MLFSVTDPALANASTGGDVTFPYLDSLAETLMKQEDEGAMAAFSPSGLSPNQPAHRYHQAVLHQLLSTDTAAR
jgi:hypothetical protein